MQVLPYLKQTTATMLKLLHKSAWTQTCKKLACSCFFLQLSLSPLLFAESAWSFDPDLEDAICKLIIDQEANHLYCANGRSFHCYNHHPSRVWFQQNQRFLAVSHGKVYSCSTDGTVLFCYTTQGEELWRNRTDHPIESLEVDSQGVIYLLLTNQELIAYNPESTTSIDCCAFLSKVHDMKIDSHDNLYCSCENGDLYCIQSDGRAWKLGSAMYSLDCLAIGSDHKIYCGSKEGFIYCFSCEGERLHRFLIGQPVSDITIDSKGNLYLATSSHCFYYADLEQLILLEKPTKEVILGTALLNNRVYFYSDHTVYHLVVTDATLKNWNPTSLQEDPEESPSQENEDPKPVSEDSANPLIPLKDKMAEIELSFCEYETLLQTLSEYPPLLKETLNTYALEIHKVKFNKLVQGNALFTGPLYLDPTTAVISFLVGKLSAAIRIINVYGKLKGSQPISLLLRLKGITLQVLIIESFA